MRNHDLGVAKPGGKGNDKATVEGRRKQCRFDPVDICATTKSVTRAAQNEHRYPHNPLPSIVAIVRPDRANTQPTRES